MHRSHHKACRQGRQTRQNRGRHLPAKGLAALLLALTLPGVPGVSQALAASGDAVAVCSGCSTLQTAGHETGMGTGTGHAQKAGQKADQKADPDADCSLHLVLAHSNDTHGHAAGMDAAGNPAYEQDKSPGGAARFAARVQTVRSTHKNVLLLDAGDQLQGSLFAALCRWPFQAGLNARLHYDAMTLGNHEFDYGCAELASFVAHSGTTVLAANLAPPAGCPLAENLHKGDVIPWRSVTLQGRDGPRRVGIVGLASDIPDTRACPAVQAALAAQAEIGQQAEEPAGQHGAHEPAGQLGQIGKLGQSFMVGQAGKDGQTGQHAQTSHFADAVKSLQAAVAELTAQGVDIIIALTHLGLDRDLELARTVPGLDIIVGGHSHSYLGPATAREPHPAGPYPIVVRTDEQPVLVVTAGWAMQYLGELAVCFDDTGVPSSWQGEAVAPGPDAPLDREMAAYVAEAAAGFAHLRSTVLGTTADSLDMPQALPDGMDACRRGECLAGLVSTDAWLAWGRQYGAQIALCNSGALRSALPGGMISEASILDMHPFGNHLQVRELSGARLVAALEEGASGSAPRTELLHCAGLRYVLDESKPAGARIADVRVQSFPDIASPDTASPGTISSGTALSGTWQALDPEGRYRVVVPDYLVSSTKRFAALRAGTKLPVPAVLDRDIVADYVRKHSPLTRPEAPRITIRGVGQ